MLTENSIIKNCLYCNAQFSDYRNAKKYCSESCASAYRYRYFTGNKEKMAARSKAKREAKKELKRKTCVNCGKIFEGKRADSRYCSPNCGSNYRYHNISGVKEKIREDQNRAYAAKDQLRVKAREAREQKPRYCVVCHKDITGITNYQATLCSVLCRSRRDVLRNPIRIKEYAVKWRQNNREKHLLKGIQHRAKKRGLDFNLTLSDIKIPEYCPVLGIKITNDYSGAHNSAPSVDRIDNSRGYTTDNIRIISLKANRLKSDATISDVRALLAYMENTQFDEYVDPWDKPIRLVG